MSYKDLFRSTAHAAAYSKFRPTYPRELYDTIVEFMSEKLSRPFQQAVDVGCGSGQNTRALADDFRSVVGVDISAAQVAEARKAGEANITYSVANFDDLGVEDGSTDLVTSAMAAHWFTPVDVFYTEVNRVLRPGGVLAIFGYGMPQLHFGEWAPSQNKRLDDIVWEFYRDPGMERQKTGRQLLVESCYKGEMLPYLENERVDSLEISRVLTLAEFIGYLSSWSFYQKAREADPHGTDPLKTCCDRLHHTIDSQQTPDSIKLQVTWPIYLLLGRGSIAV